MGCILSYLSFACCLLFLRFYKSHLSASSMHGASEWSDSARHLKKCRMCSTVVLEMWSRMNLALNCSFWKVVLRILCWCTVHVQDEGACAWPSGTACKLQAWFEGCCSQYQCSEQHYSGTRLYGVFKDRPGQSCAAMRTPADAHAHRPCSCNPHFARAAGLPCKCYTCKPLFFRHALADGQG